MVVEEQVVKVVGMVVMVEMGEEEEVVVFEQLKCLLLETSPERDPHSRITGLAHPCIVYVASLFFEVVFLSIAHCTVLYISSVGEWQ